MFVVNSLGFDCCLRNTDGLIKLFCFKNLILQVSTCSRFIRQPDFVRRPAAFESVLLREEYW